jgi:hypothetical protein
VRLHHTDRLARLDQQGLVAFETAKLAHDASKASQERAARPVPP